jgi:hypothetical protein
MWVLRYLIHFGLHSPSVLYSGTCISLSKISPFHLSTQFWEKSYVYPPFSITDYKNQVPHKHCRSTEGQTRVEQFLDLIGRVLNRSKTLWLSYSFSSKYSCLPNPSICYQSFKKNYLIDLFFLCWKLKSCGLKKNVHENKIFLFNTFRLAFSLSSLFWYMYMNI